MKWHFLTNCPHLHLKKMETNKLNLKTQYSQHSYGFLGPAEGAFPAKKSSLKNKKLYMSRFENFRTISHILKVQRCLTILWHSLDHHKLKYLHCRQFLVSKSQELVIRHFCRLRISDSHLDERMLDEVFFYH